MKLSKSAYTMVLIVLLCGLIENSQEQLLENVMKGLTNSKKMSLDPMEMVGSIIEFLMDMMEMGSGLVEMGSGMIDMVVSMGRKRRSVLEEILIPRNV